MQPVGVAPTGRPVRRLFSGAKPTLVLAAALALMLVALPLVRDDVSNVPLLLFMVPVGLCAARFGVRGGTVAGTVGALIAFLWYFEGRHFAGDGVDLLTEVLVFELVGGMVGAVADGRRRLERTVTSQQALSLDLICTASFDGYFMHVNPAAERLLGYRPDELLARPFFDFVHPDDRKATFAGARRQIEEGMSVYSFRNRYRRKDGSYIWLEWSSRPDFDANNLIAVARDVSDRVAAEEVVANYRTELEDAVRDRTAELEQRSSDLEAARTEIVHRLALAAEYRDDSTFEHIERVGQTAFLLAQELGLSEHDAELIRLAAPLHDVGKLGVSDQFLLKPGALSVAEFEQVKRHTLDGACILSGSQSDVLQVAEKIALSHHEWWDGRGYPHGLEAEQIPLAARIVALADVYDALTHARIYKRAWPIDEAVAEIRRLRGLQFDPAVVDAFEQLDPYMLAGPEPRRNRPLNHGAKLEAVGGTDRRSAGPSRERQPIFAGGSLIAADES